MNRIIYAIASLALVACRGGDDGPSGDDTIDIDAPAVVGEVTIQEVQNDAMPSGTGIELKGVVVTAIDIFGDRTGGFFVSEPGGGPNSGVKVFGASVDQVAALAVGDLVDITNAIKHEGCTMAAPCGTIVFDDGASITEVRGVAANTLVVTKTGTGTVPTPATVDAAAIAALPTATERNAEWEKWEGVLVQVTKARQISPIRPFGGADSMEDENEFRATGFFRVQSAQTPIPATSVFGTCYESITGVMDFFFNYTLAPRSAADYGATTGTACRPMATTVVELQSGTNVEVVNLTNVIVTARDDIGTTSKGFWVQDAAVGAANNGVLVFLRDEALPAGIQIGARIASIQGSVEEFDLAPMGQVPMGNTITEITNPVLPFTITAPTAVLPSAPVPGPSLATLANIGAPGEPWEGVLVRVGPLKVTNAAAGNNKIELSDNSVPPIKIHIDDDSFLITAPALNACLQVTGVMSVAVFDDLRTINPRSAGDVMTLAAALCN